MAMVKALACFGRRDATGGSGKEPKSQPGFELTNGMAERRLGNAEFCRGLGKAALSRYGQKGQQVIQVATLHS